MEARSCCCSLKRARAFLKSTFATSCENSRKLGRLRTYLSFLSPNSQTVLRQWPVCASFPWWLPKKKPRTFGAFLRKQTWGHRTSDMLIIIFFENDRLIFEKKLAFEIKLKKWFEDRLFWCGRDSRSLTNIHPSIPSDQIFRSPCPLWKVLLVKP